MELEEKTETKYGLSKSTSDDAVSLCTGCIRSNLSKVYVEVRLKKKICIAEAEKYRSGIYQALLKTEMAQNWKRLKFTKALEEFSNIIEEVVVGSSSDPDGAEIPLNDKVLTELSLHFYHLKLCGPETQQISSDDETCASRTWELPCIEFDHMWENLVFDDNIKNDLLDYVAAMLHVSDLGINTSILRINRLILLFGPPGTGKTSLCKSLAQKLSIQLNTRYKRTIFIEINSHSLFSKWYSESGKLVLKMFDQIEEISEDGRSFIVILIDEVESLSMTRKGTLIRNEPMDSVRVVNALLTQLDRIRRLPNVVLLATSNLNEVLDDAFVDRADICRWIGKPSVSAIFHILASCVEEMQRVGIVRPGYSKDPSFSFNEELLKLSRRAAGISARGLRQIPLIAYSKAKKAVMPCLISSRHYEGIGMSQKSIFFITECISAKECLELFNAVLEERLSKC